MGEVIEGQGGPQPSGLESIEAQAAAIESAPDRAQEDAQQHIAQVAEDHAAEELLAVLQMARMIAAPAFAWWSEFGAVWADKQLKAISTAGAAVMQRHGWTMGELMSQWGPYIALIGATAGPSLATYAAIKQRRHVQPDKEPKATGAQA